MFPSSDRNGPPVAGDDPAGERRTAGIVMRSSVMLLVSFLSISPLVRAAAAASETPEGVIRSLYAHHQPGRHREIHTCRRSELSKYCDTELTDLLLKDCACSKRTHEVCRLDWDPFYDAQDFDESEPRPRIRQLGDSHSFEVTITNIGERKLVYEMTRTKTGWRISNIRTSKWNLRDVLTGKE